MLKTQVQVKQGTLQGRVIENRLTGPYVSFKGIPYAKPPIGQLRFAPPAPPQCWEGVRNAFEHGDICLQKPFIGDTLQGSEDCLYLNVYTPNVEGKSGQPYPVMLFIHGGAFKTGSGNTDMYGPEFLLTKDVILVTINYRLEIFGFLCLGTEEVPGNAGLKDQVAAMKWVKDNIVSFGGDSNNITIFGVSAGSASAIYHMFSPLSKGLFHKVIAQSGVATNSWARIKHGVDRAFSVGKVFGKNTTDPKELLEFLRNIPASELGNVTHRVQTEKEKLTMSSILFGPVIENPNGKDVAFLAEPVEQLLSKGQFHDVPLVIGFTSGEGILHINDILKRSESINNDFISHMYAAMKLNLTEEQINEIKRFYFGERVFNEETVENMINLRTDTMFSYEIHSLAKKIASKASSPVYFYHFRYHSKLNYLTKLFGQNSLKLVCHGDDLQYMFQNVINVKQIDFASDSGKTVKRIVELWTNMATFGNPTPALNDLINVKWKTFEENNLYVYNIDDNLELIQRLLKERLEFWDEFYRKHKFE